MQPLEVLHQSVAFMHAAGRILMECSTCMIVRSAENFISAFSYGSQDSEAWRMCKCLAWRSAYDKHKQGNDVPVAEADISNHEIVLPQGYSIYQYISCIAVVSHPQVQLSA